MTTPLVPNYNPTTGKLVADRFEFQKHIDGEAYRQNADTINLSPTIDGYTNVQQILTNLASFLSPPTVPDATASTKGIIKLTGDLSGTASSPTVIKLRNTPIATMSSLTFGDVLSWNGFAWENSSALTITISGDLRGTSSLQRVQSLTGDVSTGTIKLLGVSSNSQIQFDKSITAPAINQETTTTVAGYNLTISAQSTSAPASAGGNLILQSGASSTSYAGDVLLENGTNVTLQCKLLNSGKSIIGLCTTSVLNTEMPSNTGDGVIYIQDAITDPTASPVGGSILYSSNGYLCVRQEDGGQFKIGSIPNPSIWGTLSTTEGQVKEYREFVQTVSAIPAIFSYTVDSNATTMVEMLLIGKETISKTTNIWQFTSAYVTYDGYDSGYAHIVGTSPIIISIPTIPSPSWGTPTLTTSTNNIVLTTPCATGVNINWILTTKLTICKTI